MKTLIAVIACAGVLASSAVSRAAQISSSTIFADVQQQRAECVVLNAGTTALPVTLAIVDQAGAAKVTSTCGGPLAAGDFCDLVMPIPFLGPFACVATSPGSTVNLRGALVLENEVLDSFGLLQFKAVRSAPLR